jgi:hypothetical protein
MNITTVPTSGKPVQTTSATRRSKNWPPPSAPPRSLPRGERPPGFADRRQRPERPDAAHDARGPARAIHQLELRPARQPARRTCRLLERIAWRRLRASTSNTASKVLMADARTRSRCTARPASCPPMARYAPSPARHTAASGMPRSSRLSSASTRTTAGTCRSKRPAARTPNRQPPCTPAIATCSCSMLFGIKLRFERPRRVVL